MSDCVVLASGGMDSAVCMWEAGQKHDVVHVLHFSYGQKNWQKEYTAISLLSTELSNSRLQVNGRNRTVSFHPYAMPIFGKDSAILQGGSGQMDAVKDLIVPGRNAVFLAIAFSLAERAKAGYVYIGAKRSKFPDCQPDFLKRMETVLNLGLGHGTMRSAGQGIELVTPLLGWERKQVVDRGRELNVPLHLTWSCYEGGAVPCGKCGACLDRASGYVLD